MNVRPKSVYKPAVGPKLQPWLWVVQAGFAALAANGIYLGSVSAMTWWMGTTQQTPFYMLMVSLHLLLGFLIIAPFLGFGFIHLATSWRRPNVKAVRYGLLLLATALAILVSGLVLLRFDVIAIRDPVIRSIAYWLHVAAPLVAIGLYVQHRLAGPRIRWEWARRGGIVVAGFIVVMILFHSHDPRSYGVKGPRQGKRYFFPSEAVTANGQFIPAETLMMDEYCLKCHEDAYKGWFHSAHHFSSFNNKAYLASVRETREVAIKRDGNTQAARWCAGCHDPVPFFSGEFDNPHYDDVNTPSSQAGITCVVCHSITNVNSTRGNADYTIEAPQHYPFASSENEILQWVNATLIKAKPEMHKKTFLKPVIKDSAFCSTCHKVSLPYALNHYKDFLRGQNHYDTFLLSGVSGHGARSFYYPPVAKSQCVDCHMNLQPSRDFGARDFDGQSGREIHNHLFLGANTGLAAIRNHSDTVSAQAKFLQDQKVRVDLFALREGGGIDGRLLGPIRPEVPALKPGQPYLVEVVVRTLGLGHPLSQGTVDSNEIWVELVAKAGDRVIGRSGAIDENGTVDPYAHFINVFMLDRHGKRIDRRNPQDIFVPLYNKQVPPGAGQVVHFGLEVPERIDGPITLEAKVNYRKFDRTYMDFIYGKGKGPTLPIVVMATDSVQLPLEGQAPGPIKPSPIKEVWQRWNDYGIGLLLEGGDKGGQKGELKQAEPIFRKVAELGRVDGWINLARVYLKEGRIGEARNAIEMAAAQPNPPAPWVIHWLTGQVNERNGRLDEAITSYEAILGTTVPDRGFDFSLDYEVVNALGGAAYARARLEPVASAERLTLLRKSIAAYRRTLAIDSENVAAHYGLGLAYADPSWTPASADLPKPEQNLDKKASHIAEEIVARTERTAQASISAPLRAARALGLADAVSQLMAQPRPEFGSRLDPLLDVIQQLGPVWENESDPIARFALTRALRGAHKTLHQLLKPDETAEGLAVANARRNDPAADQNAQSIVIHSLHRVDAPRLNAGAQTDAKPPANPTKTKL